MKNEPRYVPLGGAIMELSNRTQQGRFLLRPSAEVNDLIVGVIGRAQRLHGVIIYALQVLSDHYHMLVWVRDARQLASFMNFVDGNVALELGKLNRWRGKFWKGPYFSAVVKNSEASQLSRLHYILSNGCKEGLVATPLDWPGAGASAALVDGSMQLAGTWYDRTAQCRARQRGVTELFPEPETMTLSPLPCLAALSPKDRQERMKFMVETIEAETATQHRTHATKPAGRAEIMNQHPHRVPTKLKRSRARRFLAATGESVADLLEVYRTFLALYRSAAARLRAGETDVVFPTGCFPPRLPFLRAEPRLERV